MANVSKARAVVLLSGGMDSSVCASLAARDYDPAAVHISYGQRTEERERQFQKELGIQVEALQSLAGIPGEANAGLIGYLQGAMGK